MDVGNERVYVWEECISVQRLHNIKNKLHQLTRSWSSSINLPWHLPHWEFLTLSNPIFLPTAYSPALIYCGRERGWWITCWLKPVIHEEKCRPGSYSGAGEQTQIKKCWTSPNIGASRLRFSSAIFTNKYRGADKSLARPDWKTNWKVAIFRPTRTSLLSRRFGWTDKLLNFFFEWLARVKSLVAVACCLPGRAKDLSAPRCINTFKLPIIRCLISSSAVTQLHRTKLFNVH